MNSDYGNSEQSGESYKGYSYPMYGNRSDDDTEISIGSLFRYIFKHWRGLIACMLILGIIMGGAKFAVGLKKATNPAATSDETDSTDLAMKSYESKKAVLESNVENITKQLDEATEYMNDSLLMNIDKTQVYRAHLSYYVTADGDAAVNNTHAAASTEAVSSAGMLIIGSADDAVNRLTGSVLTAYAKALQGNSVLQTVKKNLDEKIPAKYLRELMHITVDYTNGMLDVSIVGNSKDLVHIFSEAVKDQMGAKQALIKSIIGYHTLTQLSDSEYVTADSYYQQQDDQVNSDDIYETNVANVQQNFTQTVSDLQNRLNDANTQIEALEEPTSTVFGKRDALKSGIKYGLIGLFVGLFLYGVILAINYVASGRIMDPSEVTDAYGLRILGHYYRPVKKGAGHAFDRFIANTDHHSNTDEDLVSVINISAANAEITLNGGKNVLIAGGDEKVREEFARAAEGKYDVTGTDSISDSIDGIAKLHDADGVVLFIENEKTYRKDLEAELAQLNASGKLLCGVVII